MVDILLFFGGDGVKRREHVPGNSGDAKSADLFREEGSSIRVGGEERRAMIERERGIDR
jgi:hypothetical protein